MRAFLVFSDSHTMQVAAASEAIDLILRLRGIDGTTDWYFDDDVDPVEYGVKLDIRGLSPEMAIDHLRSIWQLCAAQYQDQEVRLEIPRP